MLWLSRVEIEGFGPYAEPTVFAFPDTPGVVIIHGLNNRGKTSLLNAIYYAFFGVARDRNLNPRPLAKATNRELARQGRLGFTVTLVFRFEGDDYELVRRAVPRPGVATPVVDEDFTTGLYLSRNGTPLASEEQTRMLARILPRDVARFFLFDGELLSEYEKLLDDSDRAGRQISAAIEKILGVPILKSARAHLTAAAESAGKAVEREAARHQETAQLGEAIKQTRATRDSRVEDRARKQVQLDAYLEELEEVNGWLRARDRYRVAMERRDAAVEARNRARGEEVQLREQLKTAMADAWRTIMGERVRAARDAAADEVRDVVTDIAARLRIDAIEACHCGTCDQDVPADVRIRLEAMLPPGSRGRDAAPIAVGAIGRSKVLGSFREADVRPAVTILAAGIDRARMEQIARADEIRDLDAELAEADPDVMRDKNATRDSLAVKIAGAEKAITDETAEIDTLNRSIARLNGLLEAAGDSPLGAHRRRAEFLTAGAEVFGAAVERFKSDLRARVEATASGFFVKMTTEPDYVALRINESYGLSVIHRDGGVEEGRAASTEQVVALALMGALQANSPLRGPIIMDTPFARLDPYHTANVVRAVPDMAPQLILLVQEGELSRDDAHRLLGDRLVCEFTLERESARETTVSGGMPA